MDIERIINRLKSMEDYIKATREMVEEKHPNCRCGGTPTVATLEDSSRSWVICDKCYMQTSIEDTEAEAWATWDKVMK